MTLEMKKIINQSAMQRTNRELKYLIVTQLYKLKIFSKCRVKAEHMGCGDGVVEGSDSGGWGD